MTERLGQGQALPIDKDLPKIIDSLKQTGVLLIRAEPGAGKTTRVPQALLTAIDKEILVVEPRRLAAKLSAIRVAEELNSPLGKLVGYQMRFDHKVSKDTRIKFITEGLFPRILKSDPDLSRVGAIVIDEFHERHIQTDLALALTRNLRRRRPDLFLIVMSATLETGPLEKALNAPVFEVEGRTYPVDIEHLPPHCHYDPKRILPTIEKILADPRLGNGNILVFLTGMAEINNVALDLQTSGIQKNVEILTLSASMRPEDQQKIFKKTPKTKIILATNVAETSVTLPNITAVLDSGRAKIPTLAPWSGLTSLDISPVSKASCIQRTGRAGRTSNGVCYRLFSERDFNSRRAFLTPEFSRLDLSQTILDTLKIMASWGQKPTFARAIPWLTPPDPKLLKTSQAALTWMGALTNTEQITDLGLKLASWPLHPRLAAICEAGKDKGYLHEAVIAAAIINEGGILKQTEFAPEKGKCDLRYQIGLRERIHQGEELSHSEQRALDRSILKKVDQLVNLMLDKKQKNTMKANTQQISESEWGEILLAGFSDRIAVCRPQKKNARKQQRSLNFNLCMGRGGCLAASSVIEKADFIVVLDAHETQAKNAAFGTQIHLASCISAKTLISTSNAFRRQETVIEWDTKALEVKKAQVIKYGSIRVGEEKANLDHNDLDHVKEIFLDVLKAEWPRPFQDPEALDIYHNKVEIFDHHNIQHNLPNFTKEMLEIFQASLADLYQSFEHLNERTLETHITDQLSYDDAFQLSQLCPKSITLANNQKIRILYEKARPPWIAAKIQDFFGIAESPTIMDGRVKLVVHLLGPNKRAVQITTDLKNFWDKSYPKIRDDLQRRYPKHYWPENPIQAEPRQFRHKKSHN